MTKPKIIRPITKIFCALAMALQSTLFAQSISLPQVERVDAQPLLLITQRLSEALQSIGTPLTAEQMQTLSLLKSEPSDAKITSSIQQMLDQMCIASIEIRSDGESTVTPGATVNLAENGWRAMLVKVVNRAGVQSKLRVDSPNARPIPHGPKDDIGNRWLALSMYDGRPLNSNLSGLELEYRIVQLSSTKVGNRTARLEFSAGIAGSVESSVIRQWRFYNGADGWGDLNDLQMEVRDQSLFLNATGDDPFFSAPAWARGGRMVLRFWGRPDGPGVGQMFWWTEQLPQPDGGRQIVFQLDPGSDREYAIEFPVEGDLKAVRIDPLQGPGKFRIDWINLEYAAGENGTWDGVDVKVQTVPSNEVKFVVTDADGTPCMGAFEIRDEQGRVYPYQSKRQAPDFFFQTQIYRESGESIRLPRGKYTVKCSHGPESVAQMQTLEVGDNPVTLSYQVVCWIDTAKLGYWSGDHHIHAAGCLHYENPMQGVLPKDMLRHIMGEDVKVGCCLTWLTRSVGRVEGQDGPHRLPNFDIPAFDGIGANEFIMQVTHEVDGPDGKKQPALDFIATMNTPRETEWNIWYHVLNCGLRVVASGETDFPCMTGERLGIGRVYVKLDGVLDYDQWVEALRHGESYVSDGTSHLMDFEKHDDSTFSLTAASYQTGGPDVDVEFICNGYPVAVQKIKANGKQHKLHFPIPKPERSCWVAARIFPSAHTNPIWVEVDNAPVRVRASAQWCLAALQQCWLEKQKTYAPAEQPQARMDYEHARETYQKILDHAAE